MSSIGAGIAASVSAQSLSERQAIASKNNRERDAERVRRQLEDRFSPSKAQVEETGAIASIEGDEESPSDTTDQQRHSQKQADQAKNAMAHGTKPTSGHIDIEA